MSNKAVSPHRVAIYYAPSPESDWWQAGSTWIGRCALTGQPLPQPAIDGVAPQTFARLTADPRRYGWHATLKAPFRLAPGQDLDTLWVALHRLCQGRAPFGLAPLQAARLGNFLALQPSQPEPALAQLAADCVQQLQTLAAPLSEDALARRRRAGLTPEQDALLRAWGYPYVLQHFRFHLSLTGPLQEVPDSATAALLAAAARQFGELPACRIDRLSIFIEPTPGADFRLLDQIGFQP